MSQIDWIVAVILTVILVGLVLWSRRFAKDVSSFVIAGRKTRMWLGLSNNNAAGLGLVTIAYMAQEGFRHGFSIAWIALINAIVAIALFGFIGFGVERFRASKAMTGGQFQEMRYSRGLRLLVGFVMAIGGILNMAAFPIVGATFVSKFLGWPDNFEIFGQTIPTIAAATAVMIFLAVFFTVVCGQVGVMLTDYIQGLVIMTGLFLITWVIFRQTGVVQIKQTLETQMGPSAFNPFLLGGYGFMWAIWYVAQVVMSPFSLGPLMNRNASADNPKVVRRMFLLSYTFGQGKQLLMITLGVAAFVVIGRTMMHEGMEPKQYELIATPMYLHSICPPILMGLLFTAFLFAFISTNDTYLLSWSSIIVNDLICASRRKPMSPKQHIWVIRITVVGIGLFLYFWGIYYISGSKTTILNYLMLAGTMLSGAAIAMIFGLYWNRANTAGAYAATLTSMILPPIDLTLRRISPGFYKLSPQQAGLITIMTAIILLLICGLISNKPTKWVDYGEIVRKSEKYD